MDVGDNNVGPRLSIELYTSSSSTASVGAKTTSLVGDRLSIVSALSHFSFLLSSVDSMQSVSLSTAPVNNELVNPFTTGDEDSETFSKRNSLLVEGFRRANGDLILLMKLLLLVNDDLDGRVLEKSSVSTGEDIVLVRSP